ncbi:ankyrin [Daldinia loculata]|uniref:ankyrin n=1 Tax=Daldinia loculata TaxID=103429 RepID=UPI0020C4A584|nr:ankyrin [Daldinia loculata]KAI1647312.1 ankyrin [Daldinia loculata]
MAKLMDLPVELLQMIATAEVRSGTILRQKDLASLSLVNRWLHKVINRILYVYNVKHMDGTLFNYAAKHGNLDTLKIAVLFRLEPESWHHLLLMACQNCRREIVTWLLDRGTPLQETSEKFLNRWDYDFCLGDFTGYQPRWKRTMIEGCPALLVSINNKMEDIAILLLSHGANVSFVMGERLNFRSVLHYAACRDMVKVVEYLVQNLGISVDLKDYEGYTPLHYAMEYAQILDQNTKMLETLINLGADVNNEVNGKLPLTTTLYNGRFQHANMLLDAGSKIKPDHPQGGRNIMFRNSMQWSMLQRLVDAGADLTERYIYGYEPLEEAIIHGDAKMMSCVLAMKADKHGEESLKRDYIFDFMANNHRSIYLFVKKVETLLKSGSRIDTPLSDGRSFLSMAAMAVKSMLNHSHLDDLLKELVADSKYLRHVADPEHLTILMSRGAKLHTTEDINLAVLSSLPHARLVHNGWLARILDMGFPTQKIPSLITDAFERRVDCTVIKYLLDLVEPCIWQQNPQWLDYAIKALYPTAIDKLLRGIKNVDVNFMSKNGETLLLNALKECSPYYSFPDSVLVLLQHGADPFSPTRHSACHSEKHTKTSHEKEKYSAFEFALHNCSYWMAEKIWYHSAPEMRPDPKTFLECVPNIPGRSENGGNLIYALIIIAPSYSSYHDSRTAI